jgi:hypothetical protein
VHDDDELHKLYINFTILNNQIKDVEMGGTYRKAGGWEEMRNAFKTSR